MEMNLFSEAQLPVALSALRGVALSNGVISPPEEQLLEGIARLHGREVELAQLPTLPPAAVAEALPAPHQRRRLVQMAMVMATVDGEVDRPRADAVRQLAAALSVDDGGLRVLWDLSHGHLRLARFDHTRRLVRFVKERAGVGGTLRLAAQLAGHSVLDEPLAARYRALGGLPPGTLGRVFHDHCRERGFAFPGEEGGIGELMVFHDFGHVLAEHDTTPQDELLQAAFQSGFIRRDGFLFLLFAILQFHLGVQMTPVAAPQRGLLDVREVLWAVERGAACRVDLSDRWDHWAVVAEPVEALRERYGIPPRARS